MGQKHCTSPSFRISARAATNIFGAGPRPGRNIRSNRNSGQAQPTTRTRGGVVPLFLVLSLPIAVSCQKLDPHLTDGLTTLNATGGTGGITGGSGGTTTGTGGGGGSVLSSCNAARTQARAILEKNCSPCHQDPMKQTSINSGGPFAFVLDLDKLTTMTSPTFIGKHYVVQGDLTNSLIHSRYSPGGGMPPANVAQHPSSDDIAVLNDWISRCIGDPDSPMGWPSPVVAVGPFPPCGPANVCANGGCCVFSQCVPDGTICGPLKNQDTTLQNLAGLPGTCAMGSCQKAGASCGKVSEPCCDFNSCTASQSACLITDMTKCSQCGGTGEPCCKVNTGCLDGRVCLNGKVGFVGTCEVCGGLGQPCCGTGVIAKQTCTVASTICANDAANNAICQTCGGAGQPCCRDSGLDTCNGNLSCVVAASGAGMVCLADGGVSADASGGQ